MFLVIMRFALHATSILVLWYIFICSAFSQSPQTSTTTTASIFNRDLFRGSTQTPFQLSPSGGYISTVMRVEGHQNIAIKAPNDQDFQFVTRFDDHDVVGYLWKSDETIILVKDNDGTGNFHLFALNILSRDVVDVTPIERSRATIVNALDSNPNELIIALSKKNNQNVSDLYRLNINTGKLTLLAENEGNVVAWYPDNTGTLRMMLVVDDEYQKLMYRDDEKQKFREIATMNFRDAFVPQFFTPDNKQFYALSNMGRDKAAIVRFDPTTKKETEIIFEHPTVDVSNLSYSQKRGVLTSVSYITSKLERKFLDKFAEELFTDISRQFPKMDVAITSINRDEDKAIIRTSSDRSQGAFYLYDIATKTVKKLAEIAPWLDETKLCETLPIQYTTRDGLLIEGYLTLPQGKTLATAKNLPVVVNPHGGPWLRDVWGYRSEAQMFALSGYAVFQMNYRGSSGYGRTFMDAGDKQWGRAMQNDITDGTQWLIQQGIADPKRIAIYGGAYSGYAALMGLALTPNVYACAIDVSGPVNLVNYVRTISSAAKAFAAQMYGRIGHPERDKDSLMAVSPLTVADSIKAPLLLFHGARDNRVAMQDVVQFTTKLQQRGVQVETVLKNDEGHGFRGEENRMEMYGKMLEFLAKHIPASIDGGSSGKPPKN
jgi:dipeptidyl aminopeptidase/acylaminoacyl peptidase